MATVVVVDMLTRKRFILGVIPISTVVSRKGRSRETLHRCDGVTVMAGLTSIGVYAPEVVGIFGGGSEGGWGVGVVVGRWG